ncbi:unnamed protein product [Rhizoctonia solani]|uniref:Uncharacterized protein n=1 Tax=Rhizoctonia solani TaxID=456999 RepID=A0A8H3BWQ9_9AGAM|nr:unnamed protein product [Rhizoctonia solani]CAE6476001.1 unnamed protein product [Rhizoctonia solani]
MGLNARPNIANVRRSRAETSVYSSSIHSSLPATAFATERSRSRSPRQNRTEAQGINIHSNSYSLKNPTRTGQPGHGTRRQPHYPYTAVDQPQYQATAQNWNEQEGLSSRDQRKCHARDRECRRPVNHDTPASPPATAKHAVAMTFVPEQPAERAVAFESSLFQRDDPAVTLDRSCQRMPLSELNISPNISVNRSPDSPPPKYTPHREESFYSTSKPLEKPRVRPSPRPSSPLSYTPSRPVHLSENHPYPNEKQREVVDRAPSQTKRTSRAAFLPRPPRK